MKLRGAQLPTLLCLIDGVLRRWLSVRLETLGALAAFAAAVLAVEQRGNASTFGLVLSYALQLTMLTSMTVRECCAALDCPSCSSLGKCAGGRQCSAASCITLCTAIAHASSCC